MEDFEALALAEADFGVDEAACFLTIFAKMVNDVLEGAEGIQDRELDHSHHAQQQEVAVYRVSCPLKVQCSGSLRIQLFLREPLDITRNVPLTLLGLVC